MVQLYPDNACARLEFDKILALLKNHCRTEQAIRRVANVTVHSNKTTIEKLLRQTAEYKMTLDGTERLPNDFTLNIARELKLLSLPNASLDGSALSAIRALAINTRDILKWFKGKEALFPGLFLVAGEIVYEKEIVRMIAAAIDDRGNVLDNASPELAAIRTELDRTRHLSRKTFDGVLRRLGRQGYLAAISESYLNGRRTVAVSAEYKRIVKGIFHGASDSQKTVFIEPEETIELNNELLRLEFSEKQEVKRILAHLTKELAPFQESLLAYYRLAGILDFIRARALLAQEMKADMPVLSAHPGMDLIAARHPLLLLQNQRLQKPTVPLNLKLDRRQRILMISGPNAGGKTVAMKTAGLLQLMLQSGLLIPVDARSEVGIFKQIMVHIGDTQSIENELSTYSAHLKDMKHFLEFANGKTLFFIDELGSGSDPALGGAFAEAIVEVLSRRHAFGIITTHYMNLKAMAGKVSGIFNGAMAFDEAALQPLYQLVSGKPGSSYTFAMARRSGLPASVIDRAAQLTAKEHFDLDKILFQAEQDSARLHRKEQKLQRLIADNQKRREAYEQLTDKERKRQHFATLKLQNKIRQEELDYLKDMERKFKQIITDWKKAANKQEVITAAERLLFRKKQVRQNAAAARKADKGYRLTGAMPEVGDWVRHTTNHQIGKLMSLNGKKAIVQIGKMPFTVTLTDWVAVEPKEGTNK